jgi:pimeloyl-ACP methyl ester carboxylesterase
MRLFALLVGINQYKSSSISTLSGCINDVEAVEKLLTQQFTHLSPHILKLTNEDATRQNIIDGFKKHLKQAQKGDIVYFHYSGHGSREDAPEAFWQYFPEKKNETIVCYDSRQNGVYDLADKELAVLIAEVAQKQPHIVIFLDCCHSGSGSRTSLRLGASRQTEADNSTRTVDSYLNSGFSNLQDLSLPVAEHILLSACKASETAKETNDDRPVMGLFTATFIETITQTGLDISYAELFQKIRAKIRHTGKQEPQIEVYGKVSAYSTYLNPLNLRPKFTFTAYYHRATDKWRIDRGALQGISTEHTEKIRFAFYPLNATISPQTMITEAEIEELRGNLTILKIGEEGLAKLQTNETYQVAILNLPPPEISLYSELAQVDNEKVIPLELFSLTLVKNEADYCVLVNGNQKQIVHRASSKLITESADNELIRESLRKIALWENTRTLDNPKTKFNAEELLIEFFLVKNGVEERVIIQENTLNFDLKKDSNNNWEVLECKYQITNNTPIDVFVAAVIISPLYGIHYMNSKLIPTGTTALMNSMIGRQEKPTDKIGLWPNTEADKEVVVQIKYLIITDESLDVTSLLQDDFSQNKLLNEKNIHANRGERFLNNVTSKADLINDWFTKDLFFNLHRFDNQVIGNQEVSLLDNQIKIQSHSKLKANVNVESLHNSTRNVGGRDIIVERTALENPALELFNFRQGSSNQAVQFIELSDIQGDVSVDNPLEMKINTQLSDNEILIPFCFDGDAILPIGKTTRTAKDQVLVEIQDLPKEETKTRSIGRALRFFFYKIAFKYNPEKYFKLRWVDYNVGKASLNEFQLDKEVAQAKSILLLIHGIVGNTDFMAESVKPVLKTLDNPEGAFDLILTFDYENLNTPIQEITKELKIALNQVGINANDDKKVTILAHSMGGLVSRCLIEQSGGNKFIDKLIMAGTPNQGSVFGNLADYFDFSIKILSLGLASTILGPIATAFVGGVASAMSMGQKLLITLEQMHFNSMFIRELNNGDDPQIPYYIIAGCVQDYTKENKDERSFIEKLQIKVSHILQDDFRHDMAVRENDILEFDHIDTRSPKGQKFKIPCHHLNYFTDKKSVALLLEILNKNE